MFKFKFDRWTWQVSQDCLEDFLAVASELRVGGIGFGSKEEKEARQQKEISPAFGFHQSSVGPGLEDDQEKESSSLESGWNNCWDPNIVEGQKLDHENLESISLKQKSENNKYEDGAMLDMEKEEIGEIHKKTGKKKRHYDYLRDPIRVKANDRTGKVNINSFRTRFSTLRRKVSFLQLEHGLLPDYLLMVKNNVQKENVPNPAQNAGKYMVKCSGQVEEVLKTIGLRFNSTSMVMMANNFDFTEEKLDGVVEEKHMASEVVDDEGGRLELAGQSVKVAIQSFKTR